MFTRCPTVLTTLAGAEIVRQHQGVSGSGWKVARSVTAPFALVAAATCAATGCESSVTSVGAWEPIVEQPTAGQAGTAGSGGAAGLGATAGTAGTGAMAPLAGAGGEFESPGSYLEAELGELSGGFSVVADVAASNAEYIQPPTGPAADQMPVADTARARYRFDLATAGDYVIWGRIYSPDVSSNRFWFQVDGGAWTLWRITVGEIWFWDDFHPDTNYNDTLHFQLAAGPHELVIAKAASTARLDRLYITAQGDEPPGNDTPCRPPHSIDRGGGDCFESCGSQAPAGMHTTCIASDCAGRDPSDLRDSYDCNVCCVVP